MQYGITLALAAALLRIKGARDGFAEDGEYPSMGPASDAEFDDWAADVADDALQAFDRINSVEPANAVHQAMAALRDSIKTIDTFSPSNFADAAHEERWNQAQDKRRQALLDLEASELQIQMVSEPTGSDTGHTKAPWRTAIAPPSDLLAHGEPLYSRIVPTHQDAIIATLEVGVYAPGSREQVAATARRIVACVNALEGVATKELERVSSAFVDSAGEIKLLRSPN